MKHPYFPLLTAAIIAFASCSGEKTYKKAEDAEEAGREFIRASMDGDMKKAQFYLLADSVNQMLFDTWKFNTYNKLSQEERTNYQQANILPVHIEKLNDSTVSYSYTNTYKNQDTTTMTIVRQNGVWLVDLKDIH